MKRRLLSLITTVCIFVSIMTPCFAASPQQDEQPVTQEALNAEIEDRLDIVMADVYRQLEEQDALVLLDVYEQVMRGHVEMAVYAKYGLPVKNSNSTEMTNSDDDKRTYFPNGAITHYYAPMPYGYKPTELTTTYYSQSDTKDYLLSGAGFSIESIMELILGFVPWSVLDGSSPSTRVKTPTLKISTAMAILLAAVSFIDRATEQNIIDADYHTMICDSYSLEFDTSAHIVTGWEGHPYANVPEDAIDYTYEVFS